jgi:hypothetical protein
MRVVLIFAMPVLACLMACGSSGTVAAPQVAPQPKAEPEHRKAAKKPRAIKNPEASARKAELPRNCSNDSKFCSPPEDFVRALCKKKYPSVAIALFERNAPWRHAYVKVKDVAPVNSFGGPAAHTFLEFLEEVVILREREIKQHSVIQELPNTFDVFRLDGTCATLAQDELTTKKPVIRPHYAPIIWQQLEEGIRQALSQNQKVDQAAEAQTLACRGSFFAGGGEPCKEATQQLARAIIAAVDEGLELPAPVNLPTWPKASTASNAFDPNCKLQGTC